MNVERLVGYINQLKEQNKNEIELNKKKQWVSAGSTKDKSNAMHTVDPGNVCNFFCLLQCFNCGREAIYHCCWYVIASCSFEASIA